MSQNKRYDSLGFVIGLSAIILIIVIAVGAGFLFQWITNRYLDPSEPVGFWLCFVFAVVCEIYGIIYLYCRDSDRRCSFRIIKN